MISVGDFERVYDPSAGEREAWYINDHTMFRDHTGSWHLIGITHAEPMAPFEEVHLAHATAPTLHGPWTKQPFALTADPAWGETQLWAPHVVHHDGTYWMYVCAGGAEKTEYRIHLATSDDAWTWTRHPASPVIVDGYEARDPMVQRVGDRWVLYYTATSEPAGGHHVVAAAESDDLVHWSGRHIVYTDPMEGTMAGPTESPFVVERDGRWYLLIGPDYDTLVTSFRDTGRYDLRAYRRTRVLASDDPFAFALADQVAAIDAHAAEVVVDERGDWWVTHCGWGQGGVWLAPMHWH
ncbi:MAG: family 43 glycosylhydrolase [Acidimicrobiales bacterium]